LPDNQLAFHHCRSRKTKYQINKAKELQKRLRRAADAIDEIISIVATTSETSNIFWKRIQTRLNKAYEEIRQISKKWIETDMPVTYRKMMADEISKIKNKKGFRPKKNVLLRTAVNTNNSKQTMAAIMEETFAALDLGLNSGKKTLIRLLRVTQQVNIEEKKINQAIESGYIEKGSVNASTKKLKNELLKKAAQGKYISVVNKNGKLMNFKVGTYAELVARTKLQELGSMSTLNTAAQFESDLVQVSSHNTKSATCIPFEGKIFSISGDSNDFPALRESPPFHPNSYDKETKVYTERGWILVKDVFIGEKCLSLNIKNLNLEWKKVVETHKHKSGKMLYFNNRNFNMMVTEDHKMLYQKRWDDKQNKNIWQFIEAINLPSEARFYRASAWVGNDLKEMLGYSFILYIKFMAWYLSDGSVEKNKNRIVISQHKEKSKKTYTEICKLLDAMDLKYSKQIYGLVFYDKKICEYLDQFGNCFNKFIPDEIKGSSAEIITMFLNEYVKGDGHLKRGKIFKDYKFNDSLHFFTSSKRLADDLSELILKAGKRPSLYIQKEKIIQHHNGKYKSKKCYRVNMCNSQKAQLENISVEFVDYNDYAYCITLEGNHTLYTMRNGRCVWSGNCLHSLSVAFKEALEIDGTYQEYSQFSKGKTEIHPTRTKHIPISQRKGVS